ncbi:transposable element Tcb2 transposase [Trichonephila clavipes]|uniref:Transposable element Tcb2 transposase n=1 Tax=Trichonephila clavipes TaxID=2585209 RepID=A0A8X7BBI0_TRICX|nr:transposable element Tcb2 transposase [Trichonephila clavipes]
MPLCRFRRQHEQLSQFERGRVIGMMEAGWSARRVARQLGRSNCVVRGFGTSGSERCHLHEDPRQTSRREDHHIVRNARLQLIASSAAIQAQVAPSLGALVSS